jgi:hypothetical protein
MKFNTFILRKYKKGISLRRVPCKDGNSSSIRTKFLSVIILTLRAFQIVRCNSATKILPISRISPTI